MNILPKTKKKNWMKSQWMRYVKCESVFQQVWQFSLWFVQNKQKKHSIEFANDYMAGDLFPSTFFPFHISLEKLIANTKTIVDESI